MSAKSADLTTARVEKNDEFYTQLVDIEKEMQYYTDYLRDKVVYVNCDDPVVSNFWRYFHMNFATLGLKKLISTHYEKGSHSYAMIYTGGNDANVYEGKVEELKGDGDFRSDECIKYLQIADIVVTNPPFSLFREYISQLIEYDKKFSVLGNMNAVTSKVIFNLFKENKVWYGRSITCGDRKFNVPDEYPLSAAGCGIDENGQKYIKVKGVRWFTNMEHMRRHEYLNLTESYTPEKYPQYDNYKAIEVSKTLLIPKDYAGIMGVPITFMDKYCPEQFEILGHTHSGDLSERVEELRTDKKERDRAVLNGKKMYDRILIKAKGICVEPYDVESDALEEEVTMV